MPTKDGFDPDNFSHCFLADEPFLLANEPERQGIADEADQQLLLKVSILAAIAAAISWRRQFNLPPMLRLCRRPQRTRRAATNWLPPLNPPVGINRKVVRHHLKPCLGNSKRGRLRKMRRHRSSPYNSPFKMLRQRLREMPEHHSGWRKSNRTFGPSIMHEQRTNLRKPCSWEYWVCAIRFRLVSRGA